MELPLFTESDHCRLRRDGVDGASCGSCRSSANFRRSLLSIYSLPDNNINFTCPHGVPWPDGQAPPPGATPGASTGARASFGRAIINLATGVMSIGKTQVLRIDRVDDATFRARLAVCAACTHVLKKNGEPHRCGPMYGSWKREGGSTCGCLLKLKARDREQECPQNKWPTAG